MDWTQVVWATVVMVSIGLGYDILRRETAYIGRKDYQRLREDHDQLSKESAAEDGELGAQLDKLADTIRVVPLLERAVDKLGVKMDVVQGNELETAHMLKLQVQADAALLEHCKRLEETINRERAEREQLAGVVTEHKSDFDSICRQWREKVAELDHAVSTKTVEIEKLIKDGKNEIAGELAVASDALNKKGWR